MKPNVNSVEVHSQLSNNRHPLDGALVVAGSLWPHIASCQTLDLNKIHLQKNLSNDDGL
jgi:hypothetical protein